MVPLDSIVDLDHHPVADPSFISRCRTTLNAEGALVLSGFFRSEALAAVRAASGPAATDAYFSNATHNVYLTPPDPTRPPDHAVNRQVVSTKGCITDRQIPVDSPLRALYESSRFRRFLAA